MVFQGLFGCIDGSIIENLHLKMSVIKGCQYVGGIVGMVADNISNGNDSTIIRNCSNMGTVIGSRNYVGGIAGVIYDPLAGIFNCKNKGSIQGKIELAVLSVIVVSIMFIIAVIKVPFMD